MSAFPMASALYYMKSPVGVVLFISFWAILFTGKFPKGMFDFVVGYYRWGWRVSTYLSLMRDEYPPFSGKEM